MSIHKILSFTKSFIRIFGYVVLWQAFPLSEMMCLASLVLIVSEIIGIIEEVGEK